MSAAVVPTSPISIYMNITPKNPKKENPSTWNSDKMYSVPLSAKYWNVNERPSASFKRPSKQKRYSLKGAKMMVIQACGLFGHGTKVTKSKVLQVDACTQTDDFNFIFSPATVTKKIDNIYRTPEKKRLSSPSIFASTPRPNIHIMLKKNNLEMDYGRDCNVTQRKLLNAITPKRNFLENCNNFNHPHTTPQVLPILFDNVTPVTTKNMRSNKAPTQGRQLNRLSPKSPSKLSKLLRQTKALHKKYAMATVKLFKNACRWFQNITKASDNVDNVIPNNINVLHQKEAANNNEMFQILRKEIEELKNILLKVVPPAATEETKCDVNVPIVTITSSIPVPPPPPPSFKAPPPPPLPAMAPPPPPPPPMPKLQSATNVLPKINNKNQGNPRDKVKVGEMRPAISVEDILKVKLRKPCERSNTLPRTNPRQSQAVVTMDDLKKVRLRSTASTKSLTRQNSISDTVAEKPSNSPVSSLKRLLTNGSSSESRPKRMRQSFSKVTSLSSSLDRERST